MSLKRHGAVRTGKKYGAISDASSSGEYNQNDRESSRESAGYQTQAEQLQTDKVSKLKGQVAEVKDIMKDNIEKVIERGENINSLEDRTERLVDTSHQYVDNAKKVRQKMQRRNWKLICCIVCVVVVILTGITIGILYGLKVI